jgi:hypothetical protein
MRSQHDRLLKHDNVNTMCVEKRAFYRLISGLHTSITTHVCSDFFGMPRPAPPRRPGRVGSGLAHAAGQC